MNAFNLSKAVDIAETACGVGFAAMASCSTRQKQHRLHDWSEEISVAAFHRQLATLPGNDAMGDLPVDIENSKVAAMLEK